MEREQIGACTLYRGDCREVLPTLGKVDAVITDPPYGVNLGQHASAHDKRRQHVLVKQGYLSYDDTPANFREAILPAIRAVLQQAHRGLVFCAGHQAWQFPPPSAIGGIYVPAACGRNPWGFTSIVHCLLYGTAPDLERGAKAIGIRSTVTTTESRHPCSKPEACMRWAVDLASRPGETVCDPFMGSGTTGVACVQLGRAFVGIEIERQYFDLACQRITDAYAQPDLFVPQPSRPQQQALFAGGH